VCHVDPFSDCFSYSNLKILVFATKNNIPIRDFSLKFVSKILYKRRRVTAKGRQRVLAGGRDQNHTFHLRLGQRRSWRVGAKGTEPSTRVWGEQGGGVTGVGGSRAEQKQSLGVGRTGGLLMEDVSWQRL
jgi:hypothetical protein